MGTQAGARIFRTTTSQVGRPYSRMCLLDAISVFVTAPEDKQRLKADVLACMPAEGNTSIGQIEGALVRNRIWVERVTKAYLKKGGAPFYLFQRGKCQLIVMIKLTNHAGETVRHFVAWDGRVIHDHPYSCEIALADRLNPESSKLAFGKLFPRRQFAEVQVVGVFEVSRLGAKTPSRPRAN